MIEFATFAACWIAVGLLSTLVGAFLLSRLDKQEVTLKFEPVAMLSLMGLFTTAMGILFFTTVFVWDFAKSFDSKGFSLGKKYRDKG